MNIKERLIYFKELKYILKIAKNSGQNYSVCELKDFISLNILPPTPLYLGVKPCISRNVRSNKVLLEKTSYELIKINKKR